MAHLTGLPPAATTTTGPSTSPDLKTRSLSRATTSTVPLVALPRLQATLSCTLSTTTGRTTAATPLRSQPALRFWLRATHSPALLRRSRTLLPEAACSPSRIRPPLRPASSTLAVRVRSTHSAALANLLALLTLASCRTSMARKLLLPRPLLARPSGVAQVLASSEDSSLLCHLEAGAHCKAYKLLLTIAISVCM